ncbi:MAG: hypothetical protein EPO65_09715 [Dehalococcoidia bacterium]|nr:MAG: hypothetical protein EPO65_09715 [Dehalococcoidia bacterium]
MADRAGVLQQVLLRRALTSGDGLSLPLRFSADVVAKYRSIEGAQVIRTRTVGRVAIRGQWSLDMGIVAGAPGGAEVQVTLGDLMQRLPERERDHWIAHLIAEPASENFLQMKMAANACIDDGETADWK